MEDIEECFVKFFLSQAVEIEPATIQSLINHGYKSKISLIAMDLVLDLPQINDIPMAQRSILRRYLSTLQEYSPFSLTIDEEALKKYPEPSKPSKKRKYEVLAHDSDEDEYHSPKSSPFLASPRGKTIKTTVTKAFNGIVLPSNISPIKPRRLSIKFDAENNVTSPRDVVMAEQPELTDDASEMDDMPQRTARGRAGRISTATKKKEVVRTQSQIRYEKIKEQIAAAISPNKDLSFSQPESPENNELAQVTPARVVGRRSTPAVKVRSSVAPSRRTSTVPRSMDTTPIVSNKPAHVPTAAELAIRAKIEEKNQAKAQGKTTRGRSTRKK